MRTSKLTLVALKLISALLAVANSVALAEAPTPTQALGLAPIQSGIEYSQPTKSQIKQCTIKPEKIGKSTAWVVLDGEGALLRKFSDTNSDNVVDQWSYFKDGLEVYRDIDSDFDKKPDQYRWFHTGGTRWGIDDDQDGRIDHWRVISPHETAELLIEALVQKEERAFARLLLTSEELDRLGLGATLRRQFRASLGKAPGQFRSVAARQKILPGESEFIDFGAARPGTIPAGADGATKDVMVYDGVSALVDTGAKPEQIQIGVLVRVGEAWKLVEAPQLGSEEVELSSVFALSRFSSTTGARSVPAPTEKMQALMSDLEKLDAKLSTATLAERKKLATSRAKLLRNLAAASPKGTMRDQWSSQLADLYSAGVLEGTIPNGVNQLAKLEKELAAAKAGRDVLAHVRFQRIWSDWGRRSQDPKEDYGKVQDDWVKELRAFAKTFPNSADAAEAFLQLGMADEFAGQTEKAVKWYERLAQDFSSTQRGEKAKGALRRLNSLGKAIPLRGEALGGGKVDLASYRGKHILVQYWATWCEPCKSDMPNIKELLAKFGGRGFTVVGVNLDSSVSSARTFLKENRYPWKQLYDEGGLDGRLANEMGVMTLPLMILVDKKGHVVNRNVQDVAELESELKRLLR